MRSSQNRPSSPGDLPAFGVYLPEAHGAAQSYSSSVDDTAAVQAAINAAPAGCRLRLSRAYNIATGPLTCMKAVHISGAGGVYGGGSASLPTAITGFVTSSATADVLSITAHAVTMRDFAVMCIAPTPTAGAGIRVNTGAQVGYRIRFDSVTVVGFYDNIAVGGGQYYSFENVHSYDPVRYGLYLTSSLAYVDTGDASIHNCYFDNIFTGRSGSAAIRWEGGGGPRIQDCKINGSNQGFARGIDIAVMDGGGTSDFLIIGNSIEACTDRFISVGQAGPLNTGTLRNIVIEGNQLAVPGGTPTYGINVSGASGALFYNVAMLGNTIDLSTVAGVNLNYLSNAVIGGNNFNGTSSGSGPLVIQNSTAFTIAPNNFAFRGPYIGSGCTAYMIERQNARFTVFTDNSASGAHPTAGKIVANYGREIPSVASSSTYTNLFSFTPLASTGGYVDLILTGQSTGGASPGGFVLRTRWTYTRPSAGAVTVTKDGTDTASGTTVDYNLDTTTTPGQVNVQIRLNAASGATGIGGRAEIDVRGVTVALQFL